MKNKFLLPNEAYQSGNAMYLEKPNKEVLFNKHHLGEIYEDVFYPNYFCLELFSKGANEVIVNTKNAWQFTLGKALAFDSVIKENRVSGSKYFVVKNGNNEILGVVEKKEHSYYNIFDIGCYLRRELE